MTLPDRDNRVQWALSSKTNDEIAERYDIWAEGYDADLQSYGYRSPAIVAGIVGRYVPLDRSPILDAGAGTGIMGEVLSTLGYKGITALDLSKGMLEVAARKGVYADLRQMALGESLDFPTNHFEAIVCIGTFAAGHAPPNSLDELVRITGQGGHIIFTVRVDMYLRGGFKEKQESLEQAGLWQHVEVAGPYFSVPGSDDPEGVNQVYAYQVV